MTGAQIRSCCAIACFCALKASASAADTHSQSQTWRPPPRAETSIVIRIEVLHAHHRCVSKIPAKSARGKQARRKRRSQTSFVLATCPVLYPHPTALNARISCTCNCGCREERVCVWWMPREAVKMWPLLTCGLVLRRDAPLAACALVLVQPKCVRACAQDSRGMFLRNAAVESVSEHVSSNIRPWIGPNTQSQRERERERASEREIRGCPCCASVRA